MSAPRYFKDSTSSFFWKISQSDETQCRELDEREWSHSSCTATELASSRYVVPATAEEAEP